jgi:hypothetical protein
MRANFLYYAAKSLPIAAGERQDARDGVGKLRQNELVAGWSKMAAY